jgi:hypothetical protein
MTPRDFGEETHRDIPRAALPHPRDLGEPIVEQVSDDHGLGLVANGERIRECAANLHDGQLLLEGVAL